jgi:hypothetical protein
MTIDTETDQERHIGEGQREDKVLRSNVVMV